MPEPFDLRKFFSDLQNFSSADDNSLLGNEMATEIFVADLPLDFRIEDFLKGFSAIALLENPETPQCAWGAGSNSAGLHIIFAFKSPVVVEELRAILTETVGGQLKLQGYDPAECVYQIIPTNDNKFSDISKMAGVWRPDSP